MADLRKFLGETEMARYISRPICTVYGFRCEDMDREELLVALAIAGEQIQGCEDRARSTAAMHQSLAEARHR